MEKDTVEVKKGAKKLSDGKVNGLGSGDHVRSAVFVRNNLIACMRPTGLSRDCVAVEICHHSSEKSLVMCCLYVENEWEIPFKNVEQSQCLSLDEVR